MKTRTTIFTIIISVAFVLAMVGTSLATSMDYSFSGSTTDETDPGLLDAQVTFNFNETAGELTIAVTNQSDYEISKLYFNLSENLDTDALTFSGYSDDTGDPLNPKLIFAQGKGKKNKKPKAGGYGEYDVLLDFYVTDKTHKAGENTGVGPGETFTFVLAVTGAEGLTVDDFLVSSSPELVLKDRKSVV